MDAWRAKASKLWSILFPPATKERERREKKEAVSFSVLYSLPFKSFYAIVYVVHTVYCSAFFSVGLGILP